MPGRNPPLLYCSVVAVGSTKKTFLVIRYCSIYSTMSETPRKTGKQGNRHEVILSCVCMCLRKIGIPFMLDVRLVDAPAGVIQVKEHTGILQLSSAVL